jgi:hypothetical protein
MPARPDEGLVDGIVEGLYRWREAPEGTTAPGDDPVLRHGPGRRAPRPAGGAGRALRGRRRAVERHLVQAAPGGGPRRRALEPAPPRRGPPRVPRRGRSSSGRAGPVVAVTDYMKPPSPTRSPGGCRPALHLARHRRLRPLRHPRGPAPVLRGRRRATSWWPCSRRSPGPGRSTPPSRPRPPPATASTPTSPPPGRGSPPALEPVIGSDAYPSDQITGSPGPTQPGRTVTMA